MHIEKQVHNSQLLLILSGTLDQKSVAMLAQVVHEGISHTNKVILDFGNIAAISPRATQGLLSLSTECRQRDLQLVLCKLQSSVAEDLRPSGLLSLLPVYCTRGEAL
ncbi:MAG: STAS domain-containing protein [Desulfovibrionaceae bacterium]|nr:STAS domain-containing protein [Desulfovibrionaceae bacterium]